jgi:hypothetical protein
MEKAEAEKVQVVKAAEGMSSFFTFDGNCTSGLPLSGDSHCTKILDCLNL